MKLQRSTIASIAAHAAFLAWCVISFTGKAVEAPSLESMPVDIVTADQISKVTKGVETAKKIETPKPLVEKVAEPVKPPEEQAPKVTEKKEVAAAKEQQQTPPPEDKAKPDKKSDPKPPDALADLLKKEEKKPPEKKPEKPQPKFDPNKIAALLDKRDPTRHAAAGETLSSDPTLGKVMGTAARLSQSELDALRKRISDCWNVPAGADGAQKLSVVFRVVFRLDGTIAQGPTVIEASASAYGPVFAESGKRAILQCQPYTMLRKETYETWRDMEIQFTPSDMFRG